MMKYEEESATVCWEFAHLLPNSEDIEQQIQIRNAKLNEEECLHEKTIKAYVLCIQIGSLVNQKLNNLK